MQQHSSIEWHRLVPKVVLHKQSHNRTQHSRDLTCTSHFLSLLGQVPLASAYLTLLCWTSLVGGQTIVGTNEPVYEHTIVLTRGPTGRCPCHQRKAHSSHSQYSLSYDKNGVLRPLCAANYNYSQFACCAYMPPLLGWFQFKVERHWLILVQGSIPKLRFDPNILDLISEPTYRN